MAEIPAPDTSTISQPALIGLQGCIKIFNGLLNEFSEVAVRRRLDAAPEQLPSIENRLNLAFSYYTKALKNIFTWLYDSREDTNFTYGLTPANKAYLASFISVITGSPVDAIKGYIDELCNDSSLSEHIQETARGYNDRSIDPAARFGRRLGWYAFARVLKPKVVIETGVDKGLGSCVLASAILRNRAEGHPGQYFGTDINPAAGYLFHGRYREAGQILYGDSLESLKKLQVPIDLFINDSDHSAAYEAREYQEIKNRLSPGAVILADNAHVTDCLLRFSEETGRKFLFFQEKPEDHWYPGAGIGVSFNF